MTWTATPPTESGFYWVQIGAKPEVVYVVWSVHRQCRTIYRAGQNQPVDERIVDITRWCEVETPESTGA